MGLYETLLRVLRSVFLFVVAENSLVFPNVTPKSSSKMGHRVLETSHFSTP